MQYPLLVIQMLGGLALFVFAIMGIINAINGKAKELPLVGGFQILK